MKLNYWLICCGLLVAIVASWYLLYPWLRKRNWSSAEGTYVAGWEESSGKYSTVGVVEYRYRVDGVDYLGHGRVESIDRVKEFRDRGRFSVFYDPKNPKESSLRPAGNPILARLFVEIGVLTVLIGLGRIAYAKLRARMGTDTP